VPYKTVLLKSYDEKDDGKRDDENEIAFEDAQHPIESYSLPGVSRLSQLKKPKISSLKQGLGYVDTVIPEKF